MMMALKTSRNFHKMPIFLVVGWTISCQSKLSKLNVSKKRWPVSEITLLQLGYLYIIHHLEYNTICFNNGLFWLATAIIRYHRGCERRGRFVFSFHHDGRRNYSVGHCFFSTKITIFE